jgi:hypothetical protein
LEAYTGNPCSYRNWKEKRIKKSINYTYLPRTKRIDEKLRKNPKKKWLSNKRMQQRPANGESKYS